MHTAPGHGREDFDIWTANARALEARGINPTIPYTVDENGAFTEQAPGFTGKRVINDKGEKGDANEAVIKALVEAGNIIARGRLKHQYPHSWRSKKPVIFRNTPQWFIAMDKPIAGERGTLREIALREIGKTRWVPAAGENRINGMIESRPDWVISRQRAWGVPIAVFVRENADGSATILNDEAVNKRIADAFEQEGADAWYKEGARERFLGTLANEPWKKVDDICDVWFDSGSTHAFVLEDPEHFPSLAGIKRHKDGGQDAVMYLEGSDQHRGWFHSSLLESCGTRGVAPFDVVLTHGFVLDEQGRKMSKSLGNVTAPQDVMKQSGADILRMWVCASDYADDLRIGPEILKTTIETYRRLRNTIRWMLGSLAHFQRGRPHRAGEDAGAGTADAAPARRARRAGPQGLRRVRLQAHLRRAVAFHDDGPLGVLLRRPQGRALLRSDLVADAQGLAHRDRPSVPLHRDVARADAVLHRRGGLVRAQQVGTTPRCISNRFPKCRRRGATTSSPRSGARSGWCAASVTGALEIERAGKRIGSSLEADPFVYVTNEELFEAMLGVDLPEICITSAGTIVKGEAPPDAFRLPDVPGVAVVTKLAEGRKCARSWKISPAVGSDPQFPDVTPRDAQALREWEAARKAMA